MGEAGETDQDRPERATPRRRGRRIAAWLGGSLVLLLAAPVVFLLIFGATLRVPPWLETRIEAAAAERLGGGRLTMSDILLVIESGLKPRIELRNVGVFDQIGTQIAVLNRVSARLSADQVLRGVAAVNTLTVSGAIVTVRRGPKGDFDLVFGSGPGASGDLAVVLDSLDQAFAVEPLASLNEITADQVTISLEDARSGQLWQVTDGEIALTHDTDRVDLQVRADVFNGTEDLASTTIGFQIEKGSSRATLTATFENALAADIAAQSPVLSFLEVLDAPMSGALRTTIGDDGQLEDLAGTLNVKQGALRPTPDTPPIPFDYGVAYVDYDPETNALEFSEVSFESDTAALTGEGVALFQEFRGRWPSALVGQFRVSDMRLQPKGVFAEPMTFDRGALEFRMRLDPFSVDIGQVSLGPAEGRLLGAGRVRVTDTGWSAAMDLNLNQITPERILALWPVAVAKGARAWVGENVLTGEVSDLTAAFRFATDAKPKISLSFLFREATIQAVKFLPDIQDASGYASLDGPAFTTVIETGQVEAPEGGAVDIAGSYFRVVDVTAPVERAEVKLNTNSSITAALALLNLPPLSLLEDAGLEVDLAAGRASARAVLGFDLIQDLLIKDIEYSAEGRLVGVASDSLVDGKQLTAEALTFRASPQDIEIAGATVLNGLPMNGTWTQIIGPDADGRSQVVGTFELGQSFLDAFGIDLPPGSVTGTGVGEMTVDLVPGEAPRFVLTSDLNRVGMRLDALNWSKARNQSGSLEIAGRLGEVPQIDRLRLEAPGLSVSGVIDLNADGSLARALFDRVRVGGWLDSPVTLVGRGTAAPAVNITGGRVDMRNAAFDTDGGSGAENGPMTMQLDQLVVSESIVLTEFRGDFRAAAGLDGQFTARVNGGAAVQGAVVPTPVGSSIQIRSAEAGQVLASAGVLRNARGGAMDLVLNPSGAEGVYNGRLRITDTRIFRAPALTELINAISVVGLLDQLNTGGITLADVEADFQLTPDRVTLLRSSAIGPSIGVSLDGVYGLESGRLDMQGVISPVYFLNGIGQLFTRNREGLFGFSFRLTGAADNPRVSVNPLSILTPGAFREIFRRPPPAPSQ